MSFFNALPTILVAIGAALPDLLTNHMIETLVILSPDLIMGLSLSLIIVGITTFLHNFVRA